MTTQNPTIETVTIQLTLERRDWEAIVRSAASIHGMTPEYLIIDAALRTLGDYKVRR